MIRIAVLLVALSAGAALASESVTLDAAKKEEITTTLTQQGYDVRRVDVEDGLFEVYALKDGQKVELYLDAALKVVRTKDSN